MIVLSHNLYDSYFKMSVPVSSRIMVFLQRLGSVRLFYVLKKSLILTKAAFIWLKYRKNIQIIMILKCNLFLKLAKLNFQHHYSSL